MIIGLQTGTCASAAACGFGRNSRSVVPPAVSGGKSCKVDLLGHLCVLVRLGTVWLKYVELTGRT